MNSFTKVFFSLIIFMGAIAAGLWTASLKKQKNGVSLSVNASVKNSLVPSPYAVTASPPPAIQVSNAAASASSPALSLALSVEQAKIDDFRTWAHYMLGKLPQKTDLQNDPTINDEGSPETLRQGASDMAELYDYVDKNPTVKEAAIEAFKNCAEQPGGLDSIRAFCYAKAVRLNIEMGGDFWDPESVPDSIKNLSRNL